MYRDVRELKLGEPDYPAEASGAWPDATPAVLWLRGAVPVGARVAVVGARTATGAGLVAARQLAMGLAGAGVTVVSGGAAGVDGAAHRGALDGGGHTIVVLGTGIDVVYPARHGPLFDEVVANGGALISPFPPGRQPARWSFPRRNALIASLSRVVVIVEASDRSGSLHTADWARKLGRRLIVLVGSAGCDRLADGGAQAATNADELLSLALVALTAPPPPPETRVTARAPRAPRISDGAPPLSKAKAPRSKAPRSHARHSIAPLFGEPHSDDKLSVRRLPLQPPPPDDPRARRLYEALDGTPRDLGEVAQRAGVPAGEALALAIDLELGGLAARAAGGRYLRLS